MGRRWAIYTNTGRLVAVRLVNVETGLPEDMEYYETREVAVQALGLMDEERVQEYGMHIREVGEA